MFGFAALLVGCARQDVSESTQDPLALAAAEATAIVQQAQATALIMEARAQATALLQQAQSQPALSTVSETVTPTPMFTTDPNAMPTQAVISPAPLDLSGTPTNVVMPAPVIASQGDVDLINVTFAADSGFIMINFIAPPRLSSELYQGRISVTDEATGEVYDEIPVIPVIGPLIARPVQEGQRSYVMLVNRPPWLLPGALVTVIIADARFEHIPVE